MSSKRDIRTICCCYGDYNKDFNNLKTRIQLSLKSPQKFKGQSLDKKWLLILNIN